MARYNYNRDIVFDNGNILRPGSGSDKTLIDRPNGSGSLGSITNPITAPNYDPINSPSLNKDSEDISLDALYREVVNSESYKKAYELFSSKSEYNTWLQRLIQIPESVRQPENTFWDKIGLSNNFQDKYDASYQYCMEQISNLVAEFQSWYNSLPSTQVDQFSDAGINAAVTGVGVSGSSIDSRNTTTNPSSLSSANPMDYISAISDIVLNSLPNVVSSFTSMWKSIQDVNMNRDSMQFNKDSFLANARMQLLQNGFTLGDQSWNTLEDFNNWMDNASNDPKISSMLSEARVKAFFDDLKYQGLTVASGTDRWTNSKFGQDYEQFISELGDLQLDQFVFASKYEKSRQKYLYDYQSAVSGTDAASADNAYNKMRKFDSEFQSTFSKERKEFYDKWIQRAKSSHDPLAKFAVAKMLTSDDYIALTTAGDEVVEHVGKNIKKAFSWDSRFR